MSPAFGTYLRYSPLDPGASGGAPKQPAAQPAEAKAGDPEHGLSGQRIPKAGENKLPEVLIRRNWKEYAGESLMIIFSVLLALILTEIFNKIHENKQTREIIAALRQEIMDNKSKEEQQYLYHLQVLKNIDSALANPGFAQRFIHDGEINNHLEPIADSGVVSKDLNDVAWQVAKQANIFSKIDFSTYSLLTDIYNNQERITKSEDEIAKVFLSWESRKPENLRLTLILMRDNYHGWAVDRAPLLLTLYQQAIDKLNNY